MAIKSRIRNLVASKSEWSTKNPVLKSGELGFEVELGMGNAIISSKGKIGDGVTNWNDLPYTYEDIYPYAERTTQTVGGIPANSLLEGRKLFDIVRELVSPYVKPSFTSFKANNNNSLIYEIGTKLPATLNLTWALSSFDNVADNNTGVISSNDINAFQNLGNVNLKSLVYTLNTTSNYTYNLPNSIQIRIDGKDTIGGNINRDTIDINWVGRIIYGVNASGSVKTTTDINNLSNQILSNNVKRDYNFTNGYPFILIPAFNDPGNLVFIDNDNGLNFSMARQNVWDSTLPASISYNNGNTTFNYNVYRGEFFYNANTSIKIT